MEIHKKIINVTFYQIMGFIVTIAVIVEMVLSVNSLKKLKTVLLSFATLVVSFICVVGATQQYWAPWVPQQA